MSQHEIGLPIFEIQERPIAMSAEVQYSRAAQNGEDTFVRPVFTSGPTDQSLASRLKLAQIEFNRLAYHTLSTVVPHRFGLYPADRTLERYYRDHGQHASIPEGYILAAEVKVVPHDETRFPKVRPYFIWQGMKQYKSAKGTLADVRSGQFVQDSETGLWTLIDIEPRLRS